MAVFSYVARDVSGAIVRGDVTALDRGEAARTLRGEGKFVVSVQDKGTAAAAKGKATGKKPGLLVGDKFKADDVIYFTTQLAVMVDTGVSLTEALEACVHSGNSPRFAKALDDVIEQVRAGKEFSAALMEHATVFPVLYVSLIKASEASGQLAPILERLAEHMVTSRDTVKKIKGAITYPIVMMVLAIGVTIFLLSFVLPKFAEIYAGREKSLPVLTQMLLNFGDVAAAYGLYIVGGLLAAGVGTFFYTRTPGGRLKAERLKLGLPLIGSLYHKSYLARSLRTLGTMLQSGVSMLDGVQLTRSVCGSIVYEQLWDKVSQRVEGGQQISESLADHKQVPKSVLKMLGAGERSGQLGSVMERVAGFCESELNIAIKTLTSLIEPAIVMFLGVVVGGLVLAMLLPIFSLSKTL